MKAYLFETLEKLSNTIALSGHEGVIRQLLRPMIEAYVDEMYVDAMGNLITRKRGTGKYDIRVMVTAHMDEVGLMVMGHTKGGELQIDTVGGVVPMLLPGLHVLVGKDNHPGVIGLKAIHHAARSGGYNKAPSIKELVVDIGAKSEDEAKGLAPVGTPIGFATQFRDLGPTITGKAFDNRAGCTILSALLQAERYPFDLYGVFTTQEEVGLRGARVAAYTVEPDVAFALECTIADDLPKEDDVSPTTELGKGAAITVMDRSYITPPNILRLLADASKAEGIPYQFKQPGISGTEPGAIHSVKGGVESVTVAVPSRYIHSPVALMNRKDMENTWRLMQATLNQLTPEYLTTSINKNKFAERSE